MFHQEFGKLPEDGGMYDQDPDLIADWETILRAKRFAKK